MYTAEVRIQLTAAARAEVADEMAGLLGCWRRNGQALDSWVIAERADCLLAYVAIPEPGSLEDGLANKYVRESMDKLKQYGAAPEVTILGPDPDTPTACECQTGCPLILFTTCMHRGSPLTCTDCLRPVPLYRIPSTCAEGYDDVLNWQEDYQACDTLELKSGPGERFGEREMSRHNSSLSRWGRELCRSIAALSGRRVYYYLSRTGGRSRASELLRRCPGCEGEWLLEEPFHIFDFKCDRCMLLSSISFDFR
jgi:predicted  nucleic acid-binding Zn ribbon protein